MLKEAYKNYPRKPGYFLDFITEKIKKYGACELFSQTPCI
ncbi:hypothetical protein DCCM_0215 [Desulfocucumis palustris]|uniref:Uncharacterized protein n=1 Tax=Desulfocucumis palustris TaxID=1898651 RepID=A0A2L2X7Y3_9FIRM|nr:hypothetical protein DCCM_0215 [Desulfocucumis palustris]